MLALPPRNKHRNGSIFGPALEWCYDRIKASLLPLDPEHFTLIGSARERPDAIFSDAAGCYYDASLLFGRMARLQINRDELAKEDPLLFRELQGLCTLCQSKERCARELADLDDDWENWQQYCPNSITLNIVGSVQSCSRRATD